MSAGCLERVQTMVMRMKKDVDEHPEDEDYRKAYEVVVGQILPMLNLMEREEDRQHFMDQVMGDLYKSVQ